MRLIPYRQQSPVRELDSFFSRFFDEEAVPAWAPRLDLRESKDKVQVKVDLPGLDKKDIHVDLEDGILSIRGSRQAEHEDKDAEGTWHRVERSWGSFERQVRLGDGYDAGAVKAEYKDGVLTVSVAKKESAKPRRIEIE
jgi:HSP20 family protein